MLKFLRPSVTIVALAAIASHALAGGYQIEEKNARGLGRSYAGAAAGWGLDGTAK